MDKGRWKGLLYLEYNLRLDSRFIYEFDNDKDWNQVYKAYGSMDKLSVYDKDHSSLLRKRTG